MERGVRAREQDGPLAVIERLGPWPSMALILAPVVIINFWIYRALVVFGANNPEIVSVRPVTISRAITDPMVSADFAWWISLSALLLIPAMMIAAQLNLRLAAAHGPAGRRLVQCAYAMVGFQVLSGIGMVMLSHYRFPAHDELHMIGSYTFFVSQTLMMASGTVAAIIALRLAGRDTAPIDPTASRLRIWMGCIVVVMAVSYLTLFVLKDHDFGEADWMVYRLYTLMEPMLISAYLIVFSTYLIDLSRLSRRA